MSAQWSKVCSLAELASKPLLEAEINGVPVLVIKGEARCLVVPQSCPHMSARLADGVFDGHVLTCTKHLWQWSIDEGGAPIGQAEGPLLCYETREQDGAVYCNAMDELKYEHQLSE